MLSLVHTNLIWKLFSYFEKHLSVLNLSPAQKLDKQVLKAEIKFLAILSEHNIAFKVADHLQGLMKNMFPDSKICKKNEN